MLLAFSLLAIGVGLLAHAIGLTTATYIDGIGSSSSPPFPLRQPFHRAAFGRIRGGLRRNDILLEGRRESVMAAAESSAFSVASAPEG